MEIKLFDSLDQAKNILDNRMPRLVRAGTKNICVVRLNDEIVAFINECPHMGAGLHGGTLNYLDQIVCPLHTYKFDLRTGDEENVRCKSLQFIEVITKEAVYLVLD